MHCPRCGRPTPDAARFCPSCGAALQEEGSAAPPSRSPFGPPPTEGVSDKRILPAMLLCFFLGLLGVHRFYVGKIGTGILIILTAGGFLGIWPLIDFIMIVTGSFRDRDGHRISVWT